jgi:hypothetical protein
MMNPKLHIQWVWTQKTKLQKGFTEISSHLEEHIELNQKATVHPKKTKLQKLYRDFFTSEKNIVNWTK